MTSCDGYQLNATHCGICDPSCLTCSGPNNTQCLTCASGLILNASNECIPCPEGTYFSNGVCVSCDGSCLTCVGAGAFNCSSCVGGEFLASDNSCVICDNNCGNCSDSVGNCTSCKNNLNLGQINGGGVCQCLSNQLIDSTGTFCNFCNGNCSSCLTTLSNCQSCLANFQLTTLDGMGTCCLSTEYVDSNHVCQECDRNCKTCMTTTSNCLSCYGNMVLNAGKCSCLGNQYMDSSGSQCYDCDSSCLTCAETALNCTSCSLDSALNIFNGLGSCCQNNNAYNNSNTSTQNQTDYHNSSNSTCGPICSNNLTILVTDIDNPYKFLVVFLGYNNSNFTIKMYFLEEFILKVTASRNDSKPVSLVVLPSGINDTSFLLLFGYQNETVASTTILTISFRSSDSLNLNKLDKNCSVILSKGHSCMDNVQYYDEFLMKCVSKVVINFGWSYGSDNNVILLSFTELNPLLLHSIMTDSLLVLSIDKLTHGLDYLYSLSMDQTSNTISIVFSYKTQIIGGPYLHISLNNSVYTALLYENKTSYLLPHSYNIKLLDYYFLTESQEQTITSTAQVVQSTAPLSSIAAYVSMLMSPGSTFAIRGMLLMNIVQLLKYVDIAYPPNVVTIFRTDNQKFIFRDQLNDEYEDEIPKTFQIFRVSPSLLNNSFEDFIVIVIFLVSGVLTCFIMKFQGYFGKLERLVGPVLFSLKGLFVWNTLLMLMISKYLNFSVFSLLYFHYHSDLTNPTSELLFAIYCVLYLFFFPIHTFLLIRKISLFPTEENTQIIPADAITPNNFPNNRVFPVMNTESLRIDCEAERKQQESDERLKPPNSPENIHSNITISSRMEKEKQQAAFNNNSHNENNNNNNNKNIINDNDNKNNFLPLPPKARASLNCQTLNDITSKSGFENDQIFSSLIRYNPRSTLQKLSTNTFLNIDQIFNSVIRTLPNTDEKFYDIVKPKKKSEIWTDDMVNSVKITPEEKQNNSIQNHSIQVNSRHGSEGNMRRINPLIIETPKPDWKPLTSRRNTVEIIIPKEFEEEMHRNSLWHIDIIKEANDRELRRSTLLPAMTEYSHDSAAYQKNSGPSGLKKISQAWEVVKLNQERKKIEGFDSGYKGRKIKFFVLVNMYCLEAWNRVIGIYNPKDPKEFSFRHRILCKGFRKDKILGKYYFFISFFRFLSLSIIVTQFYSFPLAQVCCMEVVCLCFLTYLIISRPFEIKVDTIISLFNEGLVNIAFISGIFLGYYDKIGYYDSDVRMNFGWAIVFTYLILMYGLIFNMVQKFFRTGLFVGKSLWEKIKRKRNKE